VEEALGALPRLDREVGPAASPTKSESPVRTSHGSSPRERSITAKQQCSGGGPACGSRGTTTSPTSTSVPSSSGSCANAARGRVDARRDAVLEREPAVPGDVVGVRVRLEDADEPDRRARSPPPSTDRRDTADRRRPRRRRCSSPTRYEAQPRSSSRNCLNSTARRYTVLRYVSESGFAARVLLVEQPHHEPADREQEDERLLAVHEDPAEVLVARRRQPPQPRRVLVERVERRLEKMYARPRNDEPTNATAR
jgi:hypothetical protein